MLLTPPEGHTLARCAVTKEDRSAASMGSDQTFCGWTHGEVQAGPSGGGRGEGGLYKTLMPFAGRAIIISLRFLVKCENSFQILLN